MEVDASSGGGRTTAEISGQTPSLVTGDNHLWITCPHGRSIAQLDPSSGSLTSRTSLPAGGSVVGIRNNHAWVTYPNANLRIVPLKPVSSTGRGRLLFSPAI